MSIEEITNNFLSENCMITIKEALQEELDYQADCILKSADFRESLQIQVDNSIHKHFNEKPEYIKFSVNHILDKDNRTLQTHQGVIKISKIHSVFISPDGDLGRLYINCEDNVNWSYLFERYDIAEQVMDRLKIALSAPKGHRQELVGVLKTETF